MLIDRRTVLAGGAAVLGTYATGHAQEKPKLRFSAAFSESDLRAEGYKAFAAALANDLEFTPYWSNTLFRQGTELFALQRENLELCNLAPADIKKEGPSFDLPIALGMIAVTEELDSSPFENFSFVG